MIQHPKWVDTLDFRMRSLLPVKPPEIYSFILKWVVELFQVFTKELLVCAFERDWLDISESLIQEFRKMIRTTPLDESRPRALHIASYGFSNALTPSAG